VTDITRDSPSIRRLRELGIDFWVFVHPSPVSSLEQAAFERGLSPDQIIRSILFRLPESEYAMVLMPGLRQIPWKALRVHFKTNRLTLASEQEVKEVTGFELGAVNPLGLPTPMRIVLDASLLNLATVSLGSGIRGTGLILSTSSLISALPQHEVVDFFTYEPGTL